MNETSVRPCCLATSTTARFVLPTSVTILPSFAAPRHPGSNSRIREIGVQRKTQSASDTPASRSLYVTPSSIAPWSTARSSVASRLIPMIRPPIPTRLKAKRPADQADADYRNRILPEIRVTHADLVLSCPALYAFGQFLDETLRINPAEARVCY